MALFRVSAHHKEVPLSQQHVGHSRVTTTTLVTPATMVTITCSPNQRDAGGREDEEVNETLIWSHQTPRHLPPHCSSISPQWPPYGHLPHHTTLSDLIKTPHRAEQTGEIVGGRGGGCCFLDGHRIWTARCQPNERALRDEVPFAQQLERLQVTPAAPFVFTSRQLLPERPDAQVCFLRGEP